jgi:3-methyladenine DNA glycosylase AlkD
MSKLTDQILSEIYLLSDSSKIAFYTHFFRADKGDICFGDNFLAIKVPDLRKLIKKYYKELDLADLVDFLNSQYNDIRFFGQQIVSQKYKKSKSLHQRIEYIKFLQIHIASINHWNLVDTTADLWGNYYLEIYDFEMLKRFSLDKSIWVRRIGIVGCLPLIRTKNKEYLPLVLEIVTNNIGHPHEYIHKAMGWILREVGKLDEQILIDYLKLNWENLVPVTRSYATEKLRLTRDIKLLFG